jgi:hypothetical protein
MEEGQQLEDDRRPSTAASGPVVVLWILAGAGGDRWSSGG